MPNLGDRESTRPVRDRSERWTKGNDDMAITIGVARVTLFLDGSQSLKDKRHVVRSLTKRVQNQFNAAIAEVEDLDDMRVATLGIATISNSGPHADQMLASVIGFIERNVEFGSVGEIETELIHV